MKRPEIYNRLPITASKNRDIFNLRIIALNEKIRP